MSMFGQSAAPESIDRSEFFPVLGSSSQFDDTAHNIKAIIARCTKSLSGGQALVNQ